MFEAFITTLIFFVVLALGYALGYSRAIDEHLVARLGKEAANLIMGRHGSASGVKTWPFSRGYDPDNYMKEDEPVAHRKGERSEPS